MSNIYSLYWDTASSCKATTRSVDMQYTYRG